MDPQNDLDLLAIQHGSDKFGLHRYTPHYDRYFAGLRQRDIDFLEIGIGGYGAPNAGGASLRMWHDYFPKARIYGLDWFDKQHLASERIKIFQGSQADPRVMTQIIDSSPSQAFDIIVDDGSHRSEHVIATFLMLFQYVKDGGWYVIEDTETSYRPDYGGTLEQDDRLTTIGYFRGLADTLNWRERDYRSPEYAPSYLDLNVTTLHFYRNLIFIGKGQIT